MKSDDSRTEEPAGPGAEAVASLAEQFDRHLELLASEVQAYEESASMWRSLPGTPNSGGTLALHLVGNLQHWIGACLGDSGYVRDRAAEFGDRGVSQHEMLMRVARTRETVARVLGGLDPATLGTTFPSLPDHYAGRSVAWFLGHLLGHLGYHLGQLNYHRRIVAGGRGTAP